MTLTSNHPLVPVGIAPQLSAACDMLARHLGTALRTVHVFGSAVDGGLKPYSDIDVLVTVDARLDSRVRRALMMGLLQVSAWPGTHASCRALEVTVLVRADVVPWRYPPRRELQFGEWLRAGLQAGRAPAAENDHDLAILLTQVRQRSLSLFGPPAADVFEPVPEADFRRALIDTARQWNQPSDWQGDERNVVLALARLWFSAVTGGVAPKHLAAQWALERLPDVHGAVMEQARLAYLGHGADDPARRDEDVAALVRYVRAHIEQACAAAAQRR